MRSSLRVLWQPDSSSCPCIPICETYTDHTIPLFTGAKWCVENAESLGAKNGPITIFGKSAGGCLAFATALKLIDEGRGSDVLGVVPCQPITIHPDAVPEEFKTRYLSYDENTENTINTKKGMLAFMGECGLSFTLDCRSVLCS